MTSATSLAQRLRFVLEALGDQTDTDQVSTQSWTMRSHVEKLRSALARRRRTDKRDQKSPGISEDMAHIAATSSCCVAARTSEICEHVLEYLVAQALRATKGNRGHPDPEGCLDQARAFTPGHKYFDRVLDWIAETLAQDSWHYAHHYHLKALCGRVARGRELWETLSSTEPGCDDRKAGQALRGLLTHHRLASDACGDARITTYAAGTHHGLYDAAAGLLADRAIAAQALVCILELGQSDEQRTLATHLAGSLGVVTVPVLHLPRRQELVEIVRNHGPGVLAAPALQRFHDAAQRLSALLPRTARDTWRYQPALGFPDSAKLVNTVLSELASHAGLAVAGRAQLGVRAKENLERVVARLDYPVSSKDLTAWPELAKICGANGSKRPEPRQLSLLTEDTTAKPRIPEAAIRRFVIQRCADTGRVPGSAAVLTHFRCKSSALELEGASLDVVLRGLAVQLGTDLDSTSSNEQRLREILEAWTLRIPEHTVVRMSNGPYRDAVLLGKQHFDLRVELDRPGGPVTVNLEAHGEDHFAPVRRGSETPRQSRARHLKRRKLDIRKIELHEAGSDADSMLLVVHHALTDTRSDGSFDEAVLSSVVDRALVEAHRFVYLRPAHGRGSEQACAAPGTLKPWQHFGIVEALIPDTGGETARCPTGTDTR